MERCCEHGCRQRPDERWKKRDNQQVADIEADRRSDEQSHQPNNAQIRFLKGSHPRTRGCVVGLTHESQAIARDMSDFNACLGPLDRGVRNHRNAFQIDLSTRIQRLGREFDPPVRSKTDFQDRRT